MGTITANGQNIEVEDGQPLVEVLKNNGIYMSNLCYVDGLKPYAGCRTCLVDIEGPPGLQLACTAQVQDGMVVRTDTEEVTEGRRSVVGVILSNHSERCLTCHRREHCHPGDICLRDDIVTHRCLTCSKNYRCELQATCEMVGSSGYEPWVGEDRTFYEEPQPLPDRGNPFMEFDPQMCILCTRCQRVCDEKRHTSAITLGGRGSNLQIKFGAGGSIDESNCDFSGACIDVCPTAALMEHPNKWVSKTDQWTTTTCDSCSVGCSISIGSKDGEASIVRPGSGNPFSGDQICVRGRYHYDSLKPQDRLSQHFVRKGQIHVPETVEVAIDEAASKLLKAAKKGPVGVLVGGTVTNEEAWLANQIATQIFNNGADTSYGPILRATKTSLEERLGTWKMSTDMTRIPKAKAIIVVADDLEESHNVLSVRIKDAVTRLGAHLTVISSLRSELVDFSSAWLRPNGGEEGVTADTLANCLQNSNNDDPLVTEAAQEIQKIVDTGDDVIIVVAPNPVSPSIAAEMAGGAANIAVQLFGKNASEHLVVAPPEVNIHGILDMGVAQNDIFDEIDKFTGLLVIRDDPNMRIPEWSSNHFQNLDALVVIDNVMHTTAKLADVVIAEGRSYAGSGTYTQGDFRTQKLSPAIATQGDSVTCYSAVSQLATSLGLTVPNTPEKALQQISLEHTQYQDAADLLIGDGVRLNIPASGIGNYIPLKLKTASASPNNLIVITGRDQYTASDAASLKHPEAEKLHRYDRFQISEEDGETLELTNGDIVEISAGSTTLRAPLTITDRVPQGCIYISSLFQGGVVAGLFSEEVPTVSIQNAAVRA
jgi:predicted molibdopterin-dependent oxidoreductase YjgC